MIDPATAVEVDFEGRLARALVEAAAEPCRAAGVVDELTGASATPSMAR